MKILEDNYEIIKKEIPKFVLENIKIKRNIDDWGDKGENLFKKLQNNKEWIFSWQSEDRWFSFQLMYYNQVIGFAEEICPNTIKILKSLGNIKTCGFTLLYPNSSLDIHTDAVGPSFNSMAFNMLLTENQIICQNKGIEAKLVIWNFLRINSDIYFYTNRIGDACIYKQTDNDYKIIYETSNNISRFFIKNGYIIFIEQTKLKYINLKTLLIQELKIGELVIDFCIL